MNVVGSVFMAIPVVFLVYALFSFIKWRSNSPHDSSFAKDYWYTQKNPLYRSWWPVLAILVYFLGVLIFGVRGDY